MLRDIRYAIRTLTRAPAFTTVALLTIALGVGANTAIFSVVDALLIKPLPYRGSDQFVHVISNVPAAVSPTGQPLKRNGYLTVGELAELRARSTTLSHVTGYVNTFRTLTGVESATRLEGWRVEPVLFDMLGTEPFLGRTLLPEDSGPEVNVVLLSHGTWQGSFGGDRDIVGRSLTLDGTPHRVVGVMPSEFEFPLEAANRQFWVPLVLDTAGAAARVRVPMIARLADGVPIQDATLEVSRILQVVTPSPITYRLARLHDQLVAPMKPALLVLMAIVGVVLLIACANVANLLLARNAAREREIAICVALGAGRGRVIRQLLTESMLLALLGAMGGVALSFAAVRWLHVAAATLSRMDLGSSAAFPRLAEVAIDGRILLFTLGVAITTGFIFGVLPAFQSSRSTDPVGLRDGAIRPGLRRNRARGFLVVAQVAMATMLLVAAVLLVRSFAKLATVDPGYQASNVLTFQVATQRNRYPGPQIRTFAEDVIAGLRSVNGVQSAAYAVQLPMVTLIRNTAGFSRAPSPGPPAIGAPEEDARFVSRDYLQVMGITLTAGRGFSGPDRRGPRELIINQALARRDFPDESPVGQTAYLRGQPDAWQIVGVAKDVRQYGLDKEPAPQVFVDIGQWPEVPGAFRALQYFAVRTTGDPILAVGAVRDVVRQVDSQTGVYNVATMEQLVSNSISRPRLYAGLVGTFGGIAVALAVIGVYGLIAYSVAQRRREIGVRMALGARHIDVMRMVLRESTILTSIGIVLGLAGARAMTRYLEGMLFGLTPFDPKTFAAVAVLFFFVAAVASYLPARRSIAIDPAIALRSE